MELDATTGQNGLLHTEEYTIQKVVYINSANHAFSEFKLDEHLALFGANNKGKTATLSGTKIILFPETSFKSIEKKFAFKSREGNFYSKEDSYQFFFPSSKTFIVLQAKNPHGEFCIILYRGVDYQYSRLFVPVPFDDIRHWFFDSDKQDLNREMSIQKIQGAVKKLDGISVNEEKELIDIMFSGHQYDKRKARFCLIPLQSSGEQGVQRSVSAFKSLFNLTFNIEDKATLASAIATLIEMGKSRKNEQLDADLHKLNDHHDNLLALKTKLDDIEKAQPEFENVKSVFDTIIPNVASYSQDVYSLSAFLGVKTKQIDEESVAVSQSVLLSENKLKEVRGGYQSAEVTLRAFATEAFAIAKEVKTLDGRIAIASSVIKPYGSQKSKKEIIEILEEEKGDKLKLLKAFSNKEAAIKEFSDINIDIKILNKSIIILQDQLKNNKQSFLFDLDESDAMILHQLMPSFARVVMELPAGFGQDVKNFTRHFSISDDSILINGVPFKSKVDNYSKATKDDLEKELKACFEKVDDKRFRLEEINASLKSEDARAVKQDKVQKEFNELERDIGEVNSLDSNLMQREKQSAYLSVADKKREDAQVVFNEWEDKKNVALTYHESNQTIKRDLQSKFTKLNNALSKINIAKERFLPTSSHQVISNAWEGEVFDVERDSDAIAKVSSLLKNDMDKFMESLIHLMSSFFPEGIDANEKYKQAHSFEEIESIIEVYALTFNELALSKRRYYESVTEHHQLMINQKNELINAKNILTTFIKTVNQEIGEVSISNLKELKLSAKISVDFTNLIKALEDIDLSQTQLVDKAIYVQLVEFAEKKMNKRTRTVNMESIIEDIEYSYLLDGKDKAETKGQSGGTSSSITALVISVLMKRITPKYVKLNMPIIIDEIKSLDSNNASSMVKQIEKAGFSLLCATPEFDASTVLLTRNFVHMSNFSLEHELMAPECSTLNLIEHIEGYGEGFEPLIDGSVGGDGTSDTAIESE